MIANQSLPHANPPADLKKPNEYFAVKNKQGKPELGRPNLLKLAELSKLLPQLMQYLRTNPKRLIKYGVRGAANLKSAKLDTFIDFIFRLPETAWVVIDEWIANETIPVLDKFLDEHSHNEDILREKMLGLHMYLHSLTDKPSDAQQRAKLMIACNYHPQFHKLFMGIARIARDELDKTTTEANSKYENIVTIVEKPDIALSDSKIGGHVPSRLIACATAIHFQLNKIASELRDGLLTDAEKHKWDGLTQLINSHFEKNMAQGNLPAIKLGFANDNEFNSLEDLDVLARCTKADRAEEMSRSPYAFSKVLAVKHKDSLLWKELTTQQAEKLFPSLGSIIHFYGNQYPALPEYHSYAVWHVSRHIQHKQDDNTSEMQAAHSAVQYDSNKAKTVTLAIAHVMPVQQISSLEDINSFEINEFKTWFNHNSGLFTKLPADENKLLRLADGMFVHPASTYTKSLADEFITPFRAWKKLQVHQLNSGLNLHIGELPDTNIKYELSDDKEIIKKSLRQYVKLNESEQVKLAAALDQLTENEHYKLLTTEYGVDQLQWQTERFHNMVKELLSKAEIRSAIDNQESKQLENAKAKNVELQTKLDNEKATINQVQQRIEARMKQLTQTPQEIDALIDKYFDRITSLSNRFKDKPATKRKWFPEIMASLAEFRKQVEELQQKLNNSDYK